MIQVFRCFHGTALLVAKDYLKSLHAIAARKQFKMEKSRAFILIPLILLHYSSSACHFVSANEKCKHTHTLLNSITGQKLLIRSCVMPCSEHCLPIDSIRFECDAPSLHLSHIRIFSTKKHSGVYNCVIILSTFVFIVEFWFRLFCAHVSPSYDIHE